MDDVVVDTNVLAHADNPGHAFFESSREFFSALLEAETAWCLDEGFHPLESGNLSRVYSEYRATVLPIGLGLQVLAHLAATGRIRLVSRANSRVRGQIRRIVPHNTVDRLFVELAYGSTEHVLVSHDYSDFHEDCRTVLLARLGVEIVDAGPCCGRL